MSDDQSITPTQCRQSRNLLGWTQAELSRRAHVSVPAIARFEASKSRPILRSLALLRQTLVAAGVSFDGTYPRISPGSPEAS